MNETELLKPIRELIAELREHAYELTQSALSSEGPRAARKLYLQISDDLTALLTGLDKSLKEREDLDVKCPAGHASFTEGCKRCGIIRECKTDSRSQLVTIILQWHDAFYREAGDEAKRKQEQAVHAAHEAGRIQGREEIMKLHDGKVSVDIGEFWKYSKWKAERKLAGEG
jgi:transcription elongation factor Elf1